MHAQLGVDHRVFIAAHAASAHRVENRRADARGGFVQLLLGLQRLARQVFHRFELAQGRRRDDAPRQADGIGGHAQVFGVAEVVGLDQWRVRRVGRADIDPATAVRAQIAHRGGERGKAVQRFAEALQGQRLHMIFEVGRGLPGPERANAPS